MWSRFEAAISHARCASRAHGLGQLVHEVRLEGVPIDCGTEPVDYGGGLGQRRDLVVREHRGHRTGNLRVPGI